MPVLQPCPLGGRREASRPHRRRGRSPIGTALGALLATTLASVALAPVASGQAVGLGTADDFAVLAGSTVTNTGTSVIGGSVGVSPGTAIVGFPPGTITGGTFHMNDAVAAQAQADLTTAYGEAAGRATTAAVPADLVGLTLPAGVYTRAASMALTGTLTLDGQGDPGAVFVFQAGSTLTTASASRVVLINGAQACNVVWQVGSSATLGTSTDFVGNILALTSITLNTDAVLAGRALARNGAVTLDTNTVTRASCAVVPPPPAAPVAGTPVGGAPAGSAPVTGTPIAGIPGPGTGDADPRDVPPGRATWLPGPRTGPIPGPPVAGECARRRFTLRVTGRSIRDVTYSIGDRLLGVRRAKPGRTVFALRFDPRTRRTGVSRVTARVRYISASDTRPTVLRMTYERCLVARPRFTG